MPKNRRPTLGVLISHFSTGQHKRFLGIHDVAQERGVNVLCFLGRALDEPEEFYAQANAVYQLVSTQKLDGLIILSTSLTPFIDDRAWQNFSSRFSELPIISTDHAESIISRVFFETSTSVRNVICHLVKDHQRKRIAFIRGPENHAGSIGRYDDYLSGLSDCGLSSDDDLIISSATWTDRAAIISFLDRKTASGGIDFDAVVATTDRQACMMIEELRSRGIRVPANVSVIGHDDSSEGRIATPPLTTINVPFYSAGRKMAEIMLDHINGIPHPKEVILSGKVVTRQSCGCILAEVSNATVAATDLESIESHKGYPHLSDNVFDDSVHSIQTSSEEIVRQEVEKLWINFNRAIEDQESMLFLASLESVLDQVASIEDDVTVWQNILSVFRQYILATTSDKDLWLRVENLIGQARIVVGDAAKRVEGYRRWQLTHQAEILHRITSKLVTSDSLETIQTVLGRELPDLGIPSCYLALYENSENAAGYAQLMLAYNEALERIPAGCTRPFPIRQLLPDGVLPENRSYTLVVQPLYYQEDQLGYVLIEVGPRNRNVYELLRVQISSAIRGAMLLLHNIELYEKAVKAQAEAEEANRLKGVFLSTVSHELRTPLSLLVGLSDMMKRDMSKGEAIDPLSLQQDLGRIHLAARHLDGLIRDVLDLSLSEAGQLNLVQAPIELKALLESAAVLGEHLAQEKGLSWEIVVPENLPMIWGDRTRLYQVVLNLINNAVKFTDQGKIVLSAEADEEQVTVCVKDTGLGITPEDRERIFVEFHQSERTVELGYRGLGLGLAICRRLIEMHGGEIGVVEADGQARGSAFYFSLPIPESLVPDQDHALAYLANRNTSRVLLLTENMDDVRPVSDYLVDAGYEVATMVLQENQEWLSIIQDFSPGTIVLNYEESHPLSWQLVRAIKSAPSTMDIPVLFFSLVQEKDQGSMVALNFYDKLMEKDLLTQALSNFGLLGQTVPKDKTILIVDDEPEILDLHARAIREQIPTCKVLQAHNGQEALAVMQAERPELVLLDLMMPELDGFGVLEAMQCNPSLRRIPVIVLTAQYLDDGLMDKLNTGVARVLEKGVFSIDETLMYLEQALEGNKSSGNEAQKIVHQAMAYIHENYAEGLTQDDIAFAVGVSGRHLTRCFNHELGLSAMAYLRRYQIQKAKNMLEIDELNITEIAGEVGFSNSSHFGRVFRRELGMSPSRYRQNGY